MDTCPQCNAVLDGEPELCPSCGSLVGGVWAEVLTPSPGTLESPKKASISVDEFFADEFEDDPVSEPAPASPPPPVQPAPPAEPHLDLPPPPQPQPEPQAARPVPDLSDATPPPPTADDQVSFDPGRSDSDRGATGAGQDVAPREPADDFERFSPLEIPGAEPRSTPATTERVDAHVQVGPAEHHNLIRIGLGAGAAALFLVGVIGTFAATPGKPAAARTNLREQDAQITGYEIDVADAQALAAEGILNVTLTECGDTHAATGILLDVDTVVISVANNPRTDQVMLQNQGDTIDGTIEGWAHDEKLAVVSLADPTESTPLEWLGANRAPVGTELAALSLDPTGTPVWNATRVIDLRRNSLGVLAELIVDRTDLEPGAALVNAEGQLIGIVDPTGSGKVWTRDFLRPTVGRHLTSDHWVPAICPPAEPEPAPDGTEPPADGG